MLERLKSIFKALSVKEKRALYGATAVLLATSIFWGVNLLYKLTEIVPSYGGIFTEGALGQPTFLNPIISTSSDADRDLIALLFADLKILKEDYKVSPDGKTYTVTLKKDLKWSDGEPLTSDDLFFTIETIQDINSKSPLLPTWQGVIIERLSELEVKFTLKSPYAFFSDNLDQLKLIPQHIFGNIPAANLKLSSYNLEPIGSGPFSFVKYEQRKDGFITNYYLKGNEFYALGKPYLDEFRIRFFPDSEALLKAFNRLEIQSFGGLPIEETKKLSVGFQSFSLGIPGYYAIFINQGSHVALKEKVVRDALYKSINKAAIIEKILRGQAEVVYGPILPTAEGFDKLVYENALYSIEEAQKILDEAGWKLGDDGVREKLFGKNKIKLEFDLIIPQVKFLIDIGSAVKEEWAKIGIKAAIIAMSPSDINESAIKKRNYNLIFFGNIIKNNPDTFSFWHSSERFYPGQNLAVYENKKVDAVLEAIRKDLNAETRIINVKKLQELILSDTPAIFLFSPKYIYTTSKNLKGFYETLDATPSNRFDEVYRWHLRTRRVFKSNN